MSRTRDRSSDQPALKELDMYACQLNSITNRFAFFCLKKELSSRTELHFSIGLDLIQVNFVRFQISY